MKFMKALHLIVVDKAVLLTLLCRRSQEEKAVECITVKTHV